MSIHEYDYESRVPRVDEHSDLDTIQSSIDDLIASPGVSYNSKYYSLKFDNNSQSKLGVLNYDIDTHVNELTDDIQQWCANNSENPYSE